MTRTSAAYPEGTETLVVKVTLSRADYEAFRRLGDGYVTRGIRAALGDPAGLPRPIPGGCQAAEQLAGEPARVPLT